MHLQAESTSKDTIGHRLPVNLKCRNLQQLRYVSYSGELPEMLFLPLQPSESGRKENSTKVAGSFTQVAVATGFGRLQGKSGDTAAGTK